MYSNNNTEIELLPWDYYGAKFRKLHIYEELGGSLPTGDADLMLDGKDPSLTLLQLQNTGQITIKSNKDDGVIYEIPIFIISKQYIKNALNIKFICGIGKDNSDFATKIQTNIYEGTLDDIIGSMYPGSCDIRCSSDVQNSLTFYQNHETQSDFLARICRSYKRQSLFGYTWEGLLIKDTVGTDSSGNEEPSQFMLGDIGKEQVDGFREVYNPELYSLPYNPWEDTEGVHTSEDYTGYEPINARAITRYGKTSYVAADYYSVYENKTYNDAYYESDYFQTFRTVLREIPTYKLGDVVLYKRREQLTSTSPSFPYNYYVVKYNEFFCSTDASPDTIQIGNETLKFAFISRLLGIEKNGSVALGSDEEDDPTNTDMNNG